MSRLSDVKALSQQVWPLNATGDESQDSLVELFEQLSIGNIKAMEILYDQLSPKIYGLALWRTGSSQDAADVVQDVYLKLFEQAGNLRNVRKPLQYVLRITHNASIDILRNRSRFEEQSCQDDLLVSRPKRDPAYAQHLSLLVHELPPEQREAIYLKYFAGLSFREISNCTGVSLFTAASRCRLALRRLKKRLGDGK